MAGHAVVERCAAGLEAAGLGVIDAVDQAHAFAGDVAVKPGRPESIFHRQPAGREDHEIHLIDARGVADGLQHQEDRGIRMIVADGANGVETAQVVLARSVVAVPGDDVER